MSYMRHLLLTMSLLTACSEAPDPDPPPCPTSAARDPVAECETRCKTGDPATAEVCYPGAEVACLDECLRCEPLGAWCPRT